MKTAKLLLLLTVASFTVLACDTDDSPVEKAGEAIDEAADEVTDAARDAGNAIEKACEDAGNAANENDTDC